jgi:hypothetical protein
MNAIVDSASLARTFTFSICSLCCSILWLPACSHHHYYLRHLLRLSNFELSFARLMLLTFLVGTQPVPVLERQVQPHQERQAPLDEVLSTLQCVPQQTIPNKLLFNYVHVRWRLPRSPRFLSYACDSNRKIYLLFGSINLIRGPEFVVNLSCDGRAVITAPFKQCSSKLCDRGKFTPPSGADPT